MPVRDRLALLVVGTLASAWWMYVAALIWRLVTHGTPVPDMVWPILPSGAAALLLAVYGKDYVYKGRHHE